MASLESSVRGEENLRHRIKEIRIDPSPWEYPTTLDLWVDDKKYHSFPPIKAGYQLRWDFQSLPYDVHANAQIKIRIKENYYIYRSKPQIVEYLVHEAAGKTSISLDLEPPTSGSAGERAQSRITIEFPGPHDITTNFSTVRMRVNNKLDNTTEEPELVEDARRIFKGIMKCLEVVSEHYPALKLTLVLVEVICQVCVCRPSASGPSESISLIIESIQRVEQSMQKRNPNIVKLMHGLESLLPIIKLVKEHAQEEPLTATISKLVNLIEDVSYFVIIYLPENDAAQALRSSMKETEEGRLNVLMQKFTRFRDEFNAGVGGEILKRAVTNEQRALLDKLEPVTRSHYTFTDTCQEGTRTGFLEEINGWIQNQDQKMLWVHGHAGLGKSAITASICKSLDAVGALGADFFCKRDDPELRSPEQLLNTLVYRLAAQHKPYGNIVATAIGDNQELPESTLEERYTRLVENPLYKLEAEQVRPARMLFLVVDALDKCEQGNSRQLLSNFLFSISLVPWIKVIITSRPELDFKSSLTNANNSRVAARNLREEDASADVAAYIQKRMADIASRKPILEWPEGAAQQLADRAGGLFIWAVTACKFIENGSSPITRFQQVLSGTQSLKGFEKLDTLYTAAIKLSMDDDAEDNIQIVRMCLGAIAATTSRTPLSISGLEALLRHRIEPGVFCNVVERLGSVIYEDTSSGGVVRAFHPSFTEYLFNESRCNEFYMNPHDQNVMLADCCLKTMINELKFNICGLEMSHSLGSEVHALEARVKTAIQAHLEYSCQYWAIHLTSTTRGTLQSTLDEFLWGKPLIFWIEALSLLSKLEAALLNLGQLISWIPDTEGERLECADDAYRFVLYFYDVISTSAPHLYVSALAFVPKTFKIAQRMRPYFSSTFAAAGTDVNQPKRLRNIKLAQGTRCFTCSPHGDRIALGLTRGKVQMLDAGTGGIVLEMQPFDSVDIEFVVFSEDGQRIASVSNGLKIHVQDVHSGTVWRIPEGPFTHDSSTTFSSVAFTSDTHRIVAVSRDCAVWSFDFETGITTSMLLAGLPPIDCFFLSPLGHRVAGVTNNEVKVWSMDTGREITTVACGLGPFSGISLSPDSNRIATRSLGFLSIWDANTGSSLYQISQPEARGYSLAFSPDSRHLLEYSNNNLQLWNIETGVQLWFTVVRPAQTGGIAVHSDFPAHVAFSSDGCRAILRLDADTMQIWDVANRISLYEPVGHQIELKLPFAGLVPTPQNVTPVPYNPMMQIWNTETDMRVSGHSHGTIKCVIFSPDGHRYAQVFDSGIILIRDTKEDDDFHVLAGRIRASAIAFSPSGRHAVLGSDTLVRIWELGTNSGILQLEGHDGSISTVAFSPDGRLVASGSQDKSVRIWKADKGIESLQALRACEAVRQVIFLRNGEQVVSLYQGGAIRVWDTLTGTMVLLLTFTTFRDGDLYPLDCGDSQYFAFGIFKAIRSHDRERMIGRPEILGYSGRIHVGSLSPDGRYIASKAEDNKMWIWNVDTTSNVPRIMTNIESPHRPIQGISHSAGYP